MVTVPPFVFSEIPTRTPAPEVITLFVATATFTYELPSVSIAIVPLESS